MGKLGQLSPSSQKRVMTIAVRPSSKGAGQVEAALGAPGCPLEPPIPLPCCGLHALSSKWQVNSSWRGGRQGHQVGVFVKAQIQSRDRFDISEMGAL